MNRAWLTLLCQIYALLILLAAAIMSALPYSALALFLLLLMLFATLRTLPPGPSVAVNAAVFLLAPLPLAPALGSLALLPPLAAPITTIALALPVLYLIDDSLRQNTPHAPPFTGGAGRRVTNTCLSLFASAVVTILLSPVLDDPILLLAGSALALYLLGALAAIMLAIPRESLSLTTAGKRVIAGTMGSISLHVSSRASARMHGRIRPADAWVRLTPQELTLNRGKTRLDLSFTPPLAGVCRPQLQASATDLRGFIRTNQLIEPLELHIIPRAKYAEWLANKYLEQTGRDISAAATLSPKFPMMRRRGPEYLDSRPYQPGDQLKDIDWKHTLKLSQLIVRDYTEAGERAAIIAVNLAATDAEEADNLAFNLITVALTLARENIPTALTAYNHESVVLTLNVTDAREILRQALLLVKEIKLVKLTERYLEPIDIAKIRRNIAQLKLVASEPARRLLDVFSFEYRAIEEAARDNPATAALSAVTRQTPAPAMIFLVSLLNHDAEAVLVTAEKLARRKFTTVPIETR